LALRISTEDETIMNDDLKELLSHPTATVPDVGRICYGLSRNGSYNAADRGEIPTIKIGRLLKVPTSTLRAKLGLGEAA
jgi:hypothetical protein